MLHYTVSTTIRKHVCRGGGAVDQSEIEPDNQLEMCYDFLYLQIYMDVVI